MSFVARPSYTAHTNPALGLFDRRISGRLTLPPYGPAQSNPQPDPVPAKFGILARVAIGLIAVIGIGVLDWSMTLTPQTPAASDWTSTPPRRRRRT
jgi:hypothetical protein